MRYLLIFMLAAGNSGISFSQGHDLYQRLIKAPDDPVCWESWRDNLVNIRNRIKKEINYNDSLYDKPAFQWASDCYNIYFLMLFDRSFYDPLTNTFKVRTFIKELEERFGMIDGIVLWHAYPRIGIDPRNQFDHYREFPGGLDELRTIVDIFHDLDIKVFIDYNPWDTGTGREDKEDIDVLADIIQKTGADGIFLDTLTDGSKNFRNKLDRVRPGVVLESELALPTERIYDHHMSWAQWFDDSDVPGILWDKWIEPRHMMHMIKRWNHNHSSELQTAWMNGSGMLIWENVFGTLMPWNDRDRFWLRMMTPIQHRFTDIFKGNGWYPLYPCLKNGVYANKWGNDSLRLWTIVNRNKEWIKGPAIKIGIRENEILFDLMRGVSLKSSGGDSATVSLSLPPLGLGAVLAIRKNAANRNFFEFLKAQSEIFRNPEFSIETPEIRETAIHNRQNFAVLTQAPADMALIEGIPDNMTISYMQRECGFYSYDHYIPPPDAMHKILSFNKKIIPHAYAIDKTPVTNREYARFLKESGYIPDDTSNFLKHWHGKKPPVSLLDQPVVYVDLDDARAYAGWAGKKLPTEEEWQFAASGKAGYAYPWGNKPDPARCNCGELNRTTNVTKYENGRSSFGCYDMCGNVWELTDSERTDGRTDYCILKGGSWFKASGSKWYFQGGDQLVAMSAKYILFYPGLDRSPSIGFRCVVDIR